MELDPVSASSMGEDRLEAQGKQMEKEIQRIRVEAEQCRRSYVSRVCALLNTVNGLSEKMDEVLRMVDEIELIKQQQREIERQCEMLEEMSDVVPEILDLTRSIDVLESRMGQTKKSDDEESNQRMSAPPLVPIPQSTIPEASLKFRSSPPSNRSSSDISSNVLFSSTHSSAIRSLPKKSSPLPHRSPPPLSTIPSHTTSPHKSPPPPISLPPSLKSPPPPMSPSLKSPLSSTSPPPSLNSPPPPMPPPPSLKSPSPKSLPHLLFQNHLPHLDHRLLFPSILLLTDPRPSLHFLQLSSLPFFQTLGNLLLLLPKFLLIIHERILQNIFQPRLSIIRLPYFHSQDPWSLVRNLQIRVLDP